MKLKALLFSVFAGFVFSAAPANAALFTTFVDQATWAGAVTLGSEITADFSQTVSGYTPPGSGGSISIPTAGFTLDTIKFYDYDNGAAITGGVIKTPSSSSSSFGWTSSAGSMTTFVQTGYANSTSELHVLLPAGVTAWSVIFGTGTSVQFPDGAPIFKTNNVACVAPCPPTTTWPNANFFGVTSDTPFTSVDIFLPDSSAAPFVINDFSIGTAAVQSGGGSTPEVCTLLLTGSALVAFARMLRRLKLGQTSAAA